MRRAYRVLARLVAGLVAVQAAVVACFGAGESRFVEGGGVIDKAMVESAEAGGALPFPEVIAIPIHGLNGGMVIPVVSLILLAVSFGAGVPRARKWAGVCVSLQRVQMRPLLGVDVPMLFITGSAHPDWTPEQMQAAAALAPQGTAAVLDGAAYLGPLEAPEGFSGLVRDFWAAHPA